MYAQATALLKGRLIVPYQREGVQWMLQRETAPSYRGGFLCDEMGLGKTIQLITVMLGNPKNKTLVVVPKTIVTQWVEEIARFAPYFNVGVFDGPKRTTDSAELEKFDIVVAPYSVIVKPVTPLHALKWDRIILDEGHEIRTLRSKRHISLARLNTDIRWIVSGTPIYNSMKDFVNLCLFLGLSKPYVQAKTDDVRAQYVLRRTKDDVARFNERLALPECDFANVEIDMNPEEFELYREVFVYNQKRVRYIAKNAENIGMHQMELLECLLRIRQVMVLPQLYLDGVAKKNGHKPDVWTHRSKKMDTLFQMVREHPDEKTLIFCQFIKEMDYIEEELGGNVFRIDGAVSKEERVEQIEGFKRCTSGAVFLIQIKSGGVGLNLQEATRVYITSPAWNPATELQAIARSHRTGQTGRVIVRKLICVTSDEEVLSVEEAIVNLQGHKSQVCAEVLNDQRMMAQIPNSKKKGTSISDVLNIFQV